MILNRGGLLPMLKEGSKHLSGIEEAVIKNIEASIEMSELARTSLGPNGLNKMIITKHDKLLVTNDAATIIKELDVVHPAAKMLALAAEQQEIESGDGTNFVLSFGGELLRGAQTLIHDGLYPSDVIAGYTKASERALQELEKLTCFKVDDLRDVNQVAYVIKSVISSKQPLYAEFLSNLIAKACVQIVPAPNPGKTILFNVENVRVCKVTGAGITDSKVVKGLVMTRDAAGSIKRVTSAKIAVLATGIDLGKTETKGNVVLKTAKDLLEFSKGEEETVEQIVKAISEIGTKVIVSGGSISDIAMHYIERYNMMCVKTQSKFELQRICRTTGATPLVRLGAPTPEELGFCDVVSVEEIGSTRVCIFRQDTEKSQVSTLILRGATANRLDDIERAIDDGVNVFKALTKDEKLVAGAGAVEIELNRLIQEFAESCPGLEQYSIKKYGAAFQVLPRTIAENSGYNATEVLASLNASHQKGNKWDGVDVGDARGAGSSGGSSSSSLGDKEKKEVVNEHIRSAKDMGVFDHQVSKANAIRLTTEAVLTILRIDQIIMAKESGGPRLPPQGARDGD